MQCKDATIAMCSYEGSDVAVNKDVQLRCLKRDVPARCEVAGAGGVNSRLGTICFDWAGPYLSRISAIETSQRSVLHSTTQN